MADGDLAVDEASRLDPASAATQPGVHGIDEPAGVVQCHVMIGAGDIDQVRASLEVGKLYPTIPDPTAAKHGYVRIVDESGQDYGYPADRFFSVVLPKPLEKALLRAAS